MKYLLPLTLAVLLFPVSRLATAQQTTAPVKPNILFFFADDWGRYASIYADSQQPSINDIVKTPNIDRIGREGVVFTNAFVQVSSCTPSRASLVTGRYFWNCGSQAFLHARGGGSDWSAHTNPFSTMTKFPDLLRENGYYVRRSQKTIDFTQSPAGPRELDEPLVKYQRYGQYVSEAASEREQTERAAEVLNHPRAEMRRVLRGRQPGQPFFFIYGTINVHRPYRADSGQKLWGIQPETLQGRLPKFLPDVHDVRRDLADYLGEVQAADAMLGVMLEELEAAGELDRTLIILSGDNGMPGVPRGKTNCYDLSVRAPLLVRWPAAIPAGRRVSDFVSLMDVGPTLLEVAGQSVPAEMNGRSFRQQLTSTQSGWIDPQRNWVVLGRERHVDGARVGNIPYPMRALRTREHLYIRNFKPDRWPMGDPDNIDLYADWDDSERHQKGPYRDIDESLTKAWLINHRSQAGVLETIELTLNKRPAEELYDIQADPDQLHNLAADPNYAPTKADLAERLKHIMTQSQDPRLTDAFDHLPYVSTAPPTKNAGRKSKASEPTE